MVKIGDKLLRFAINSSEACWDDLKEIIDYYKDKSYYKLSFGANQKLEEFFITKKSYQELGYDIIKDIIFTSNNNVFVTFNRFPNGLCPISAIEYIPSGACFCTVRDLWTFGHKCGQLAPIDKISSFIKKEQERIL